MSKSQKIVDLEAKVKRAEFDRDDYKRQATRYSELREDAREGWGKANGELDAARREAKLAAAAAESATLASIKAGLIPVTELKKVIASKWVETTVDGITNRTLDIEINGTPTQVQQAILDALVPKPTVNLGFDLNSWALNYRTVA